MKIDITYNEYVNILTCLLAKVRQERRLHSALIGINRKAAQTIRKSSRSDVADSANLFRKLDAIKLF